MVTLVKQLINGFVLIALLLSESPSQSFLVSMACTSRQRSTWTKNTDCGVPFWTVLNIKTHGFPPASRIVVIYIEPQNFSRENLRKIFQCLSEKYLQPEYLTIIARSDEGSLQRQVDYLLDLHSIRPDGSPEKRKSLVTDYYEDPKTDIGFYRATYQRSDVFEQFAFSPDPTKSEMSPEFIRQGRRYEATGDTNTDLVRAAGDGLEEEVVRLLNSGADMNGRNRYGNNPILAATLMGRGKIVTLLLNRGADINQKDPDGWTPLMYALARRREAIAEEPLRRGADVNARAENGDTALIIAVSTSQGKIKMVEQLLGKGADVNVKDKFGRTPLMIAEEYEHMDYVRDLLRKAMGKRQ